MIVRCHGSIQIPENPSVGAYNTEIREYVPLPRPSQASVTNGWHKHPSPSMFDSGFGSVSLIDLRPSGSHHYTLHRECTGNMRCALKVRCPRAAARDGSKVGTTKTRIIDKSDAAFRWEASRTVPRGSNTRPSVSFPIQPLCIDLCVDRQEET